jgi:26S proteasome regulatory subunit N10
VAVDIVSFGSEEENCEKLEIFHGAVNSNNNSHLVTVPPGTILSDMLFGTPIFMEEGAGGGEGTEEGGAPRCEWGCEQGGGGG